MPRRTLERIRAKISDGSYDMTIHALVEMTKDDLDIFDIEHAILIGRLSRTHWDERGRVCYTVNGFEADEMSAVGIVGRFTESGRFLIITVYRVEASKS
jgi:hypothetical protein